METERVAFEAVDPAAFPGDRQHILAGPRAVQGGWASEVPIVFVARNGLKTPVQATGGRVDGNDGIGIDSVCIVVRPTAKLPAGSDGDLARAGMVTSLVFRGPGMVTDRHCFLSPLPLPPALSA
jgi:hypothetical protein